MSNRGGKRPGAGRPKGAVNKKTAAMLEKISAEGITPLEYMLQVMRDESEEPARRLDAARSAAPYVHPKLTAQQVSLSNGKSFEDMVKELIKGD